MGFFSNSIRIVRLVVRSPLIMYTYTSRTIMNVADFECWFGSGDWFVLVMKSETFGRNPILFQFLLDDSKLLFQFQSHFELIFPFDFDELFSNNIIYHLTCTYNGFNSHVLLPAKKFQLPRIRRSPC